LLITVFCLGTVLFLLAVITGLSFASSWAVPLPVRGWPGPPRACPGVTCRSGFSQPRDRDELSRLGTSFNEMASAGGR